MHSYSNFSLSCQEADPNILKYFLLTGEGRSGDVIIIIFPLTGLPRLHLIRSQIILDPPGGVYLQITSLQVWLVHLKWWVFVFQGCFSWWYCSYSLVLFALYLQMPLEMWNLFGLNSLSEINYLNVERKMVITEWCWGKNYSTEIHYWGWNQWLNSEILKLWTFKWKVKMFLPPGFRGIFLCMTPRLLTPHASPSHFSGGLLVKWWWQSVLPLLPGVAAPPVSSCLWSLVWHLLPAAERQRAAGGCFICPQKRCWAHSLDFSTNPPQLAGVAVPLLLTLTGNLSSSIAVLAAISAQRLFLITSAHSFFFFCIILFWFQNTNKSFNMNDYSYCDHFCIWNSRIGFTKTDLLGAFGDKIGRASITSASHTTTALIFSLQHEITRLKLMHDVVWFLLQKRKKKNHCVLYSPCEKKVLFPTSCPCQWGEYTRLKCSFKWSIYAPQWWLSHLASWDHFHPLTTVIVWTPICQETLHTDGERERDKETERERERRLD